MTRLVWPPDGEQPGRLTMLITATAPGSTHVEVHGAVPPPAAARAGHRVGDTPSAGWHEGTKPSSDGVHRRPQDAHEPESSRPRYYQLGMTRVGLREGGRG